MSVNIELKSYLQTCMLALYIFFGVYFTEKGLIDGASAWLSFAFIPFFIASFIMWSEE